MHLLTLGGDFRLMRLDEGRHILAFSRNDGPVRGEPAPEPKPADHLLQDMYFAVQDPRETLPDLPWLLPRRHPPPLIRREGSLRVTLASVPVGEW